MSGQDPVIELCEGSSGGTGGYIDFTKAAVDHRGRIKYSFTDDSLSFLTATSATGGGSEKMRITSAGNVGIGTTSPSEKLHLDNGSIRLGSYDSGGSQFIGLGFQTLPLSSTNTYGGMEIEKVGSDHILHLHTHESGVNAGRRMTILKSGNVGIGTTSPSETLDVKTNINIQANLSAATQGDNQDLGQITFRNSHRISTSQGTSAAIKCTTRNAQYDDNGSLAFLTGNGANNATEKMVIDNDGNVGIGTTSPSSSLHVAGEIDTGASVLGVHLGLDTASNSTASAYIDLVGSTTKLCAIDFNSTSSLRGRVKYDLADDTMQFTTGGSIASILITDTGNVGIGSAGQSKSTVNNSGKKLYVDGAVQVGSCHGCSDDRIKHNETEITHALEILNKLQPKHYFKTTKMYDANFTLEDDRSNLLPGDTATLEHGVIAQDLLQIPELAFTVSENNGDIMSVDYNSLFVLSIQALKDLSVRHEELRSAYVAKVTQHDHDIQQMMSRLEALESS